jgi:hypothetical protein
MRPSPCSQTCTTVVTPCPHLGQRQRIDCFMVLSVVPMPDHPGANKKICSHVTKQDQCTKRCDLIRQPVVGMAFRSQRLGQHPPPTPHICTSAGRKVLHFLAQPTEHSGTSIKQRPLQLRQLRQVPVTSAPDLPMAFRSRSRCSALRCRPTSGSSLAHSEQTPIRVLLPQPAEQKATELKTVAKLMPVRVAFIVLRRRRDSCRTLAALCNDHLRLHSRPRGSHREDSTQSRRSLLLEHFN